MKPTSAKAKGSAGERELAKIFGGKRNPGSGAWGGNDTVDMDPPYDGLAWEVKRRAKLPAIATEPLAQAEYASRGSGRYPAAAYREDRGRWIVAMYAEDLRAWVDAVAEVGNGQRLKALVRQARKILDEVEGLG